MIQAASTQAQLETPQWFDICKLADIFPNTGVCALVKEQQVAIFRVQIDSQDHVYALDNFDPFSKTNVLSRGILGDRQGVLKVASPIYKQNFNLVTGQCLDNEDVSVSTYPTQVVDGRVQISIA